jgi:hypothetical protein
VKTQRDELRDRLVAIDEARRLGDNAASKEGTMKAGLNATLISDLCELSLKLSEAGRKDDAKLVHLSALVLTNMKNVLDSLVTRCDGAEGVRADGSNIDTLSAHMMLATFEPEEA